MGRMKDKYFDEINSDDDDQSELNYLRENAEKYIHDTFKSEMETVWSGFETDYGEEMKETDILFVIDWSGSMNDEITAVLTALNQFAQNYSDEDDEYVKATFAP